MTIHPKSIAPGFCLAALLFTTSITPALAEPIELSVGGYFIKSLSIVDADPATNGGDVEDVEDEIFA